MFERVLDENIISIHCSSKAVFNRGKDYYFNGRVQSIEYNKERCLYVGHVKGNHMYRVLASFNHSGVLKGVSCTCQGYRQYEGICKHLVAVLLAVMEENSGKGKGDSHELVQAFMNFNFNERDMGKEEELHLKVELDFSKSRWQRDMKNHIELKLGTKRLYVVKSIPEFINAYQQGGEYVFTKKFTYNSQVHTFRPMDGKLLKLLAEMLQIMQFHQTVSGDIKELTYRKLPFPESWTGKIMETLKNSSFNLKYNQKLFQNVRVSENELPVNIKLRKDGDQISLDILDAQEIYSLDNSMTCCLRDGLVYILPKEKSQVMQPLYKHVEKTSNKSLNIPCQHREEFVTHVLPQLKNVGEVEVDEELDCRICHEPLQPQIYLDGNKDRLEASILFKYGDREIKPFDKETALPDSEDKILARDVNKESKIVKCFEDAEFIVCQNNIYLEGEEEIISFLTSDIQELKEQADIFYSQGLKNLKVRPSIFCGRIGVVSESSSLEVTFSMEGISREDFIMALDSYKEKKKYYQLKDGTVLSLQDQGMIQAASMVEDLGLKKKDLRKESISLPLYRALDLETKLGNRNLFSQDEAFKKLLQRIQSAGQQEYILPDHLESVLRDYQKTGFNWLKSLAELKLGGILADDMGLGKTVQLISLLFSDEEKLKEQPALIVVPTSLIYNWQAEFNKFAPQLQVLLLAGLKDEREKLVEKIPENQVVITSYSLLRRDFAYLSKHIYSYCILDEAQQIKNPTSQTAQAAKQIKAENRFALTGTPIENSLTEIWSIFDFLMPGYLHSSKKFASKYGKVAQENEEKGFSQSQDLAKKVSPFIMRRLKKDVLSELPPKIELEMLSELTREQKKIYLSYLERIRSEAQASIEGEGFQKNRIKILAGLTRLRQICCHPALFLENYNGKSGKLEQLLEFTTDTLATGHRMLVFSQFTSMLSIIRQAYEKAGIKIMYLDGSVPSLQRMEMVDKFNSGQGEVFLISLKAGGTGLNLVGADTVVHYDLWWNPAVEDQASDRAHRIGQEKQVQVYKFISLGTIDQRINELQKRKKELTDRIIRPGENPMGSLSENDIRSILDI